MTDLILCNVMNGSCMNVVHDTDTSTNVDVKYVNCLVRTASQRYVYTYNQPLSLT